MREFNMTIATRRWNFFLETETFIWRNRMIHQNEARFSESYRIRTLKLQPSYAKWHFIESTFIFV